MKAQFFLLIAIMVISLNAHPFLRKLADTKDSCTKAGKDYEEIPAQCKAGDKIYNVTKEEECKSGEWEALSSPKCSVSAITKEKDCTGTPKYTAAVTGSDPSCKKGSVDLSKLAVDAKTCEVTLQWIEGSCSLNGVDEEDCHGTLSFTASSDDGEGNITPATCMTESGKNIITLAPDDTTCTGTITWTAAHCSVEDIKEKDNCKDKPSFTPAVEASVAKCTLDKTEITDSERLASQTACETPLVWLTGTCKNNLAVTVEAICKSKDPEFTAATIKCVDKASSNSNSFLSFKFALLLVVYLLF